MYKLCVGRAVNLHTLHNLFKGCNILSPNLQRKHSFRMENWSDQMRGLRRISFPLLTFNKGMWSTWWISQQRSSAESPGQISQEGQMPVDIKTSKAKTSDQAPPIGVSLLSCPCIYCCQNWRVGVADSRQHLELETSLQLAATQMNRQFLLDLVNMNSV